MSLSTRLTLALSIAALASFSAIGWWQLRAEETDLRRAVGREVRLLGRALQVAFENALRDQQSDDVQETLRGLEEIAPHVDIFVFSGNGQRLAASDGAAGGRWSRPGPDVTTLRFTPDGDPVRAELVVPLRLGNGRTATLLLARPLDDMHRDLSATRVRISLSVAGYVLLTAVLTLMLSRAWVGQPLKQMVAHMTRVRAGDLSPARTRVRRDEIGETLREFDALVVALAEARALVARELEARRQLEEKLRDVDKLATVGQLAAGLAHEIGSPLQILEGRLARLETKADDPSETRRVARILLDQVQRITRIVSRLTGLARRRTGHVHSVDVPVPVRRVVELLEGEARRRGVSLRMQHPAERLAIRADPDLIQQVVLNLLRNALEATPRGGHITVRLAASSIRDGVHETPAVRVEIEDDGRGMDEATASRVFEPFFTTRARDGGSGLGLAVVKGLIDELRGRIVLRTALGAGTHFAIDLPVDEPLVREVS